MSKSVVIPPGSGDTFIWPDQFTGPGYLDRYPELMEAEALMCEQTVAASVIAQNAASAASAYALGPTTSTTSNTISTGTKTFALAAALSIGNGAMLRISDAANPANFLTMRVTSGGGTTSVTGTVATTGGSGTKTSWVVQVTGADGVPATDYIAQGLHTLPVYATAMARVTGAEPAPYSTVLGSNNTMVSGLSYNKDIIQRAQFIIPTAKSFNPTLNIAAQHAWFAATGTGNVVWGVRAKAVSHDDPIDGAWGTAVTTTSGWTAANDSVVTSVTATITPAGSPAKSDTLIIEVYRDASNGADTFSADAILWWTKIFMSFDAQTDA